MKIYISNRQTDLALSLTQLRAVIRASLQLEKCLCDEVTAHFVTEKKIANLHALYFNDPSPTDCISFPIDGPMDSLLDDSKNDLIDKIKSPVKLPSLALSYHPHILGEIFVCPAIAIQYAQTHDQDPYRETTLYIVHGLLHLMGYDDLDPKDRKKMRQAEKRHLAHLTHQHFILTHPKN